MQNYKLLFSVFENHLSGISKCDNFDSEQEQEIHQILQNVPRIFSKVRKIEWNLQLLQQRGRFYVLMWWPIVQELKNMRVHKKFISHCVFFWDLKGSVVSCLRISNTQGSYKKSVERYTSKYSSNHVSWTIVYDMSCNSLWWQEYTTGKKMCR